MKVKIIILFWLLLSVSCEDKNTSKEDSEELFGMPWKLITINPGDRLVVCSKGSDGVGVSFGFYSKDDELLIFQVNNESRTGFVGGSQMIISTKGEQDFAFCNSRFKQSELVSYYDADGDGFPEYRVNREGIFKIDRVSWEQTDKQSIPPNIQSRMFPKIGVSGD